MNCFWIIKNLQQHNLLIPPLKRTTFIVSTFFTLYTSIQVKEVYTIRGAEYLNINRQGIAYWSRSQSSERSVTLNELVNMLEYLVDNIFIEVGNRVFRQCIGIPMGTDSAPLIANLSLFYYEYNFMKGPIKTNINLAKRFSTTVRYIIARC